MRINGSVTLLGDDVDTDVIYPGRYLAVLDPVDQSRHLFESLGPDVQHSARRGGVIVAGWNFGCGSSREHAATAMIGAGIRLVVAKSFARIFFRNAINNGLAVVECPGIVDGLAAGAPIEADLEAGVLQSGDRRAAFPPLAPPLLAILAAGGLWAAAGRKPVEVA